MVYTFAWVGPTDRTFLPEFEREDEKIFSCDIGHAEGGFPTATVVLKNLKRGLLAPGYNVWAWIARDGVPVYFGRLVGIPEELIAEKYTLKFISKPPNYIEIKQALAETMKVAPYWDEVWISPDRVNDPDTVLEAREELWHIDRITLELTSSNIINGEDGTLDIGIGFYNSVDINFGTAPLKRVRVEAEISWDQHATGEIDISWDISKAFQAAGSTWPLASSFTGQGLESDWPKEGDDLDGGWSMGFTTLVRADNVWKPQRYTDAPVAAPEGGAQAVIAAPMVARFYLWEWCPWMFLNYDVSRQRIERLYFDLNADVQSIVTDDDDVADFQLLTFGTKRVVEPIDPDGSVPIRAPHSPVYLRTDRGRQSLVYLIMVARAKLLSRSRAVEVTVTIPYTDGMQLSCRKNFVIRDPRIPGGVAAGKIIEYHLITTGKGEEFATVTIGCTIGRGNTIAPAAGVPSYAQDGYMAPGYQMRLNATVMPETGDLTYNVYDDIVVPDDGVNFDRLDIDKLITRLEVINGEDRQREVVATADLKAYSDPDAAIATMNLVFTEVWLELQPLTGGPFETEYPITVSRLQIPKTIDLEAPAQ